MFNWVCHLRREIVAVILLGVVLYHPAGLMRLLERALSALPYQQAAGIIFVAVIVLLGGIFWNCAAMVVGDDGPPVASIPLGGRLGAGTMSDLERWAEIHKHEGESVEEAVKRLEPLWNQRELSEGISITQRRRHEAAHAVITHALGGTVMSADVRDRGYVGGNVEYFPPIPSDGPAHTMWARLQINVAGTAQDTLDGILNYGSSPDIGRAQYQATMLTAAAWTPNGYTGPLNPGDLIAYAIETNKKLLEERQHAVAAIETALTDKDELTGVEVHQILDNLNTPPLEPAAEVAS